MQHGSMHDSSSFKDRQEAGRLLARRLLLLAPLRPVVLALPRGGVPVGFEVAQALQAPLDLVLVRKIGAPGHGEFAIGAVADGVTPELVLDEQLVARLGVSRAYLDQAKQAALEEIERRRQAYLGDHQAVDLTDRTAIVVDDGVATGATVLAALGATRQRQPAHMLLAVPVAPPETLRRLRPHGDDIVCLLAPPEFYAVGQFYGQFPQLSDAEVVSLLREAHRFGSRDSANARA